MGGRVILAGLAVAVAIAIAPGPAMAQEPVGPAVFFKVVFNGSGHYIVDGQASCDTNSSCWNGPIHQDLSLDSWTATYPVVQLGTGGAAGVAGAADQQLNGHYEGTDTDCDDISQGDCHGEDCTADYASDPGAPAIALDGSAAGDSLKLRVEAPWHPIVTSISCLNIHMPDPVLPDMLRAVTTIPFSAFDKGTVTRQVSSGDPGVYRTPPDCTAEAHADNSEVTSCTRTANWTGTITITPDCVTGTAGGAPWCIKKKQKDEAAEAAKDYDAAHGRDQEAYKGLGCGPGATNHDSRDVAYACAAAGVKNLYDAQMAGAAQRLADDPPDIKFGTVAQPHVTALGRLRALEKRAPDFVKLETRYAKAAALIRALLVAQNRATGAFLVASEGADTSAALAKQNAAVLTYARRAAKLLHGQRKIAKLAAREAGSHGKPGKKLAALLLTAKGRTADTRMAAALSAIAAY